MPTTIKRLNHAETIPMDLLKLADPSEEMISKYLHSSVSWIAQLDDELAGGFVMHPLSESELEIKNMAVYPDFQRKGVGAAMIKHAKRYAKIENYESIVVKTADVSTEAIAFYEKQGFKLEATVKGHFIKYYQEPIIENGKEAMDQLIFRLAL